MQPIRLVPEVYTTASKHEVLGPSVGERGAGQTPRLQLCPPVKTHKPKPRHTHAHCACHSWLRNQRCEIQQAAMAEPVHIIDTQHADTVVRRGRRASPSSASAAPAVPAPCTARRTVRLLRQASGNMLI